MDKMRFDVREFYIAITNRCNLSCIMCTTGRGKYDASRELTTERWKAALDNLNRNCRIRRVTFGGGEPLLRPDLAQIMKHACASDIETVNVISNGVLFDDRFISGFTAKELKKIGIIFSIDGLAYDHDFIRGTGVFEKVFPHFENVYRDYFVPGRINSLSLSSILMQENLAHYVDFLEHMKKYEGVRIDIQPVIPNNELCYVEKHFRLTGPEMKKLRELVDYLEKNPQLSTRPMELIRHYPEYFDNKLVKSGRCLTGYESLNITFDGFPYLCGKQIEMPLDSCDFREVFHSDAYQKELARVIDCKDPCLQGLHINPENEYAEK